MEKKNNPTTTIKSSKSDKATIGWKEVTIGGITGIALGGASAYAASSVSDSAEAEPDTDPASPSTADGLSPVAEDMSFDEAFAAAREAYGPGATFEWHGQVYGTYYATEWNAMTPQQQQAFTQSAGGTSSSDTGATHTGQPYVAHHEPHSDQPSVTPTNHTPGNDTHDDEPPVEPQVEIIGFEETTYDDGTTANYGYANVEGSTVMFVDFDGQDDRFDAMVVDYNENGRIDDGEITDISDANISVSQFRADAEAVGAPVITADSNTYTTDAPVEEEPVVPQSSSDYLIETNSMPDYMNEVDPGTLA